MADTRGRGSSPSRAIRNRSRERERVKERETNDQKVTIDREKVQILICVVSLKFCSREIEEAFMLIKDREIKVNERFIIL